MQLSSRFGLAGIAALALLSSVQWLRGWRSDWPPVAAYLLGVLPNVTAAIAIPFVLMSVWADRNRLAPPALVQRRFAGAVAVAGVGLLICELLQRSSATLVFDFNDIGATLLGLMIAAGLFALVIPRR